jgi:hypothetical protein
MESRRLNDSAVVHAEKKKARIGRAADPGLNNGVARGSGAKTAAQSHRVGCAAWQKTGEGDTGSALGGGVLRPTAVAEDYSQSRSFS